MRTFTHSSAPPSVDSSYVHALRARGNPWRIAGAVAAGALIFSFLVFVASAPVAIAVDTVLGLEPYDPTQPQITIGLWAGGNLLIASMIPISGLLQWAFFGVRPGRISSVLGRFRWKWLAEVAVIFIPLWIVVSVVMNVFVPAGPPAFSGATFLLVAAALITIPLQSAGEEYLFRGLLFRAVGALFTKRTVALVIALIVSSITFAIFHAPDSGWALAYYVIVGACFAVMTHRTGGLEASSLVHATGNTMLTLPILLAGNLDDLTAVTGPLLMIPAAATVLATAIISWQARRRGIITVTQSAVG